MLLSATPIDDPTIDANSTLLDVDPATVDVVGYQATTDTDAATPSFDQIVELSTGLPLSSSGVVGLTPTQIRTAYGINQITFSGGTITGDGSGQTIAIVDAYDDPNIASDLHNFDVAFGIADPASFLKVSQTGSTTVLPSTDPAGPGDSWAVEISLDVEWVHAIAPGANILLVEANSSSYTNLLTAVDYARNYAGVSVVSMSWGGSESSTEVTSYDAHFQTPTGHIGVTFVASTGDSGEPGGYPAYSPNVVAVGGTQLTLSGNNYVSETGWSGSGGGISQYETQPSYQKGIVTQSTTQRTIPDVSFDASPSSGVAVYDSWDYGSSTPWAQIGGTSFSAPAWGAIIAIADQGRTIAGIGTLDGPSQTLPDLYALSASDFHDITTGSNGFAAGVGYDLVTGRGSPIANLVVADLSKSPDLIVATTTPATGSVVSTPPTDFVVQFSDPYTASSIQASDLTVNSIAANSFTLTNSTTVTFHFNTSPVVNQGVQTIALAAGAVTRQSDGKSLDAYSTTFRYDVLVIAPISTTPSNGSSVAPPLTTLDIQFNEAYATSSIGVDNLTVSQGTVTAATVLNSTTVRYTLSGVTNEGTFTFSMAAGAVTDTYGNPGAAYNGSLNLDITTLPFPTPLVQAGPPGTLVYSGTYSSGAIGVVGDTDSFTISLDAGQTLTVLAIPAAGLTPTLQVRDPSNNLIGSVISSAAGNYAVLQTISVTTAGTYTITVGGASNTTGSYSLQVTLNAALEAEGYNGPTDDTRATAQNIDSGFVSLGGAASVATVLGGLNNVGVSTVTLSSVNDGWWDATGLHTSTNLNYIAGEYNSREIRDYFVFNLSGITQTITGAQLKLQNPSAGYISADSTETYTTFDVSTPIATLEASGTGQTGIFADLGTGTIYASTTLSAANDGQTIPISLNSAALSYLNANRGGQVAVGGAVTTISGTSNQAIFASTGSSYTRQLVLTLATDSSDYYSLSLTAGQSIAVALKNLTGSGAAVSLQDANGNVLASSVAGATNFDQVINNFVASSTGTYYLAVTGASAATYSVSVTKNATLGVEANNSLSTAEPIVSAEVSGDQRVLGADWRGRRYRLLLDSIGRRRSDDFDDEHAGWRSWTVQQHARSGAGRVRFERQPLGGERQRGSRWSQCSARIFRCYLGHVLHQGFVHQQFIDNR